MRKYIYLLIHLHIELEYVTYLGFCELYKKEHEYACLWYVDIESFRCVLRSGPNSDILNF